MINDAYSDAWYWPRMVHSDWDWFAFGLEVPGDLTPRLWVDSDPADEFPLIMPKCNNPAQSFHMESYGYVHKSSELGVCLLVYYLRRDGSNKGSEALTVPGAALLQVVPCSWIRLHGRDLLFVTQHRYLTRQLQVPEVADDTDSASGVIDVYTCLINLLMFITYNL